MLRSVNEVYIDSRYPGDKNSHGIHGAQTAMIRKFHDTKPDGTPQKLLDVSKIEALGWKARTGLKEGIGVTYKAFLKKVKSKE